MRLAIFLITVVALALPVYAECPECTCGADSCPSQRTYIVYGARLGGDFPKFLGTGYDASWLSHLDGTYPIYVDLVTTNVTDSCGCSDSCFAGSYHLHGVTRRFTTPQLLSTQAAFAGHHTEFKVVANGIGSESGYGNDFSAVEADTTTPGYYACLPNQGLEAPVVGTFPLDANGNLYVRDVTFGGVGRKTTIILERVVSAQACTGQWSPKPWLYVAVVIGWESPGCHQHDWPPPSRTFGIVNPDSILIQTVRPIWGSLGEELLADCPRHVVSWCSPDFTPTSPGAVDAADLAVFSPNLGLPVSWGTCSPLAGGTWRFNLAGFNTFQQRIDASDLGAFALSLGDYCGMAPSKAGLDREEERNAIMTYFGFALTGNMVSISPTQLAPEWALVDPVKNRLAILDPYGYQRNLAGSRATLMNWTQVKSLYR